VNPSFHIHSAGIVAANASLFIEAGPMGVSIVIADERDCFSTVIVYAFSRGFDAAGIAENITRILKEENCLQQTYKKTSICWTFPQSILVPNEFMNIAEAGEMLNLVYGDIDAGTVRSDFIFTHNLHNVYRIPEAVLNGIPPALQFAPQTHQYSLIPSLLVKHGDRLLAIFYNHRMVMALSKHGHLQVIQNVEYRDAEDASWHLLNACESFDVKPNEVVLHLSGMINIDSPLYAGLYKYFEKIELEPLPENATYSAAIKDQPAHFFSHLFAQALCV
jgi:hypothetical protein